MDKEEIITIVKSYISQSLDGLEIENPKCDFKSIWYNLTETKGINEFLKDTSAMANTFGLDAIIVIGYNNKGKTFHSSVFSDSGLKDTSDLVGLINKKIDKLFNLNLYDIQIDGHNLSIIQIPPSLDKPHVIRQYQTYNKKDVLITEEHKIFVRRGTSIQPATKYDLELMYYDRKNIIPEYGVVCNSRRKSLFIGINAGTKIITSITGSLHIIIENIGRRTLAIAQFKLKISLRNGTLLNDVIEFDSKSIYKQEVITIKPNDIISQSVNLNSDYYIGKGFNEVFTFINEVNANNLHAGFSPLEILLVNGEKLSMEIRFTID